MQERVNEKTVAIAVQATRLTGRMLARIGELYLRHVREKHRDNKIARSRDPSTYKQNQAGKVKIKTLMQEGDGVSNVEIKDDSIKVFERLARRNGIRYAVKKDKNTQPPTYYIFFKGKSAEVVQQINIIEIMTYYALGKWLIEVQQKGEDRAKYGEKVIDRLSEALTEEFGRGYSRETLRNARKFYQTYQGRISQTLFTEFTDQKSQTMFGKLKK